jgi:hypothetical protein
MNQWKGKEVSPHAVCVCVYVAGGLTALQEVLLVVVNGCWGVGLGWGEAGVLADCDCGLVWTSVKGFRAEEEVRISGGGCLSLSVLLLLL